MLTAALAEKLEFAQPIGNDDPLHILILDDSGFDRLRVRREFRRLGLNAEIDEISCVCQLDALLARKTYDLAVLDFYLPDGTGLDAVRILRQSTLNAATGAILISGNPWIDAKEIEAFGESVQFMSKDQLNSGMLMPLVQKTWQAADI